MTFSSSKSCFSATFDKGMRSSKKRARSTLFLLCQSLSSRALQLRESELSMKGVAFTTRSIRFHAPKGREARKKIYKLISMSTVQSSSYTGFENCSKSLILSDDSFRWANRLLPHDVVSWSDDHVDKSDDKLFR